MLITLLLLTVFVSYAQTEEELILRIREQFKTTNANLLTYEKIIKSIEGESLEGGVILLYRTDGDTVLMHCEFYGESGNLKEDYYFWNSLLYFVFTVREIYDYPNSNVIETEENRYYFNNGKMIRWLDKNKNKVNIYADEFSQTEENILYESFRLKGVFNNEE